MKNYDSEIERRSHPENFQDWSDKDYQKWLKADEQDYTENE